MSVIMKDEQILEFLEKMKPKIKKELSQTTFSNKEDLEQEIILFILKVIKEKEFEEVDFFELIERDT